jgi:hypothetical protein
MLSTKAALFRDFALQAQQLTQTLTLDDVLTPISCCVRLGYMWGSFKGEVLLGLLV